jgi:hypothetical protein
MSTVATHARSGSVLVATVDIDPKRTTEDWLTDIRNELGSGLVPTSLTAAHLKGPRGPAYVWGLMHRAVKEAIRVRAQSSTNAFAPEFRQLFNFVYNDGSRMVTFGGILLDPADSPAFTDSGLQDLWFIRGGSEALDLIIPKLTFKEMKALDRCMPWNPHSESPPPALPPGAAEQYSKVYRQFPHFVEADF